MGLKPRALEMERFRRVSVQPRPGKRRCKRPGTFLLSSKGVSVMPTFNKKPQRTGALLVGVLSGAMGLAPIANRASAQEGFTNIEELKLEDLLVITATLHEQSVLDAPAAITVVTAAD